MVASGVRSSEDRSFIILSRGTIVACVDGIDVGFVITNTQKNLTYTNISIFVDKKYQCLGIGNLLFEIFSKSIENCGVFAFVNEFDPNAQKFFEKRGFSPIYLYYWAELNFHHTKSKITSWFLEKSPNHNIVTEYTTGSLNNISEEAKKFIKMHNESLISNQLKEYEKLIKLQLFSGDGIFDCTEVYTAREDEKVLGIAVFSIWHDIVPTLDFLHVETLNLETSFFVKMLLIKHFLSNKNRINTRSIEIDANSLNLKNLSLLNYLNDGLPHGYLVYARPPATIPSL